MGLNELTSRQAVLDAIDEFDRLGRGRFLDHHGFAAAKNFYVKIDDRYYDSKAIAGVAYGNQFPDRDQLRARDFSGGENTVKPKLEELGFEVVRRTKIPI